MEKTNGTAELVKLIKDNLSSCPFCGGEAKLENMGWPHHVYCTECGVRMTGRGYAEEGELDAIMRWNRRFTDGRFSDEE